MELKFRAFDDGKMVYFKDIKHLDKVDGEVLRLAKFFCNVRNDSMIMQYVGFKDKKGVEIYKGDIIIGRVQKEFGEPLKTGRYKVDWEDSGFVATIIDGDGCDTWAFFFETNIKSRPLTECEVIGNIYENPELLETRKPQLSEPKVE